MLRASTLSRIPEAGPAAEPAEPDVIRRIEAWVASYLDGHDAPAKIAGFGDWQMRAVELFQPMKSRPRAKAKNVETPAAWQRVAVSRKHGASVIKLLDQTLVKESDIAEFGEELRDLIEAGHRRVVLDFAQVERLSCAVVPVLAEASRLCRADGQGDLRMIHLRPEVAPVVGLSPITRGLCPTPDEAAAVDGPWPGADIPRPLPELLLAGLLSPPVLRVSPPDPEVSMAATSPDPLDEVPLARTPAQLALVVRSGNARGRVVGIPPKGLRIGRDPECEIRSDHAFLSRHHAEVFVRGGRTFLRDLGSTNGTLRNGDAVGREPIELDPGDRIEFGPLRFAAVIDPRCQKKAPDDEEIAHWLGPEPDEMAAPSSEDTVYDVPATTNPIRRQVIEGVLILTPLDPQLLSGSDVSVFRDELAALLEAPAPHRVVINLKLVARLSNAAVGLLVAHHVRLDRLGGALRLCEPHARVAEILNQIRLPLLLDVYPTEDEAVLSNWDRPAA